jgi:hypothetical protein
MELDQAKVIVLVKSLRVTGRQGYPNSLKREDDHYDIEKSGGPKPSIYHITD